MGTIEDGSKAQVTNDERSVRRGNTNKLVIGYCLTALISCNGAKVIGPPTNEAKFAFILGLERLGY